MARPKGTTPPKQRLNLTVSEDLRAKLEQISQETNSSISALLERWASDHQQSAQDTAQLRKLLDETYVELERKQAEIDRLKATSLFDRIFRWRR